MGDVSHRSAFLSECDVSSVRRRVPSLFYREVSLHWGVDGVWCFVAFLSCVCFFVFSSVCVSLRVLWVQLFHSVDLHSNLYMLIFTLCFFFSNKRA